MKRLEQRTVEYAQDILKDTMTLKEGTLTEILKKTLQTARYYIREELVGRNEIETDELANILVELSHVIVFTEVYAEKKLLNNSPKL